MVSNGIVSSSRRLWKTPRCSVSGRTSPSRRQSCIHNEHFPTSLVTRGETKNSPADRSGRHSSDDARLKSPHEATHPLAFMDDFGGVKESFTVPDALVPSSPAGLQEGLDDIQGSRDGCGDSASESSGKTVRHGIVSPAGVEELAEGVICRKLYRGEWDGHSKRCRIRNVKGFQSLEAVHRLGTITDRLVCRSVDLHPLLHDVERIHEGIARGSSASAGKTSDEGVMLISDVASQVMLDALVSSEVDCVGGTCGRNIRLVDPSDKAGVSNRRS